jgi:hypothetical protein
LLILIFTFVDIRREDEKFLVEQQRAML